MCMVAYELRISNLVGLILVETFNSLDAFRGRKQASLWEVLFFFKYNP